MCAMVVVCRNNKIQYSGGEYDEERVPASHGAKYYLSHPTLRSKSSELTRKKSGAGSKFCIPPKIVSAHTGGQIGTRSRG